MIEHMSPHFGDIVRTGRNNASGIPSGRFQHHLVALFQIDIAFVVENIATAVNKVDSAMNFAIFHVMTVAAGALCILMSEKTNILVDILFAFGINGNIVLRHIRIIGALEGKIFEINMLTVNFNGRIARVLNNDAIAAFTDKGNILLVFRQIQTFVVDTIFDKDIKTLGRFVWNGIESRLNGFAHLRGILLRIGIDHKIEKFGRHFGTSFCGKFHRRTGKGQEFNEVERMKEYDLLIMDEALAEYAGEGRSYAYICRMAERYGAEFVVDRIADKYKGTPYYEKVRSAILNGEYWVKWDLKTIEK